VTRTRLLRAAAEAFDVGGYLGVNLNNVVTSLGLTKGALYHFFPTKEALAVEIVDMHFAAWEPLAQEVFTSYDNKLDALVEVTYRVAALFQSDPIVRAGARLSSERHLINTTLHEPFIGWVRRLESLVKTAKTRGEVRAGIDPRATAELVVDYFYGAQLISQHLCDRRDLLVRLDHFWEAFLPHLQPA